MSDKGTLFLIPNTLGSHDSRDEVLPSFVQKIAANCTYFVVENSKVARQFLKAINVITALQNVNMSELNINTPDSDIAVLLEPLLAGYDVGLLSDAGCPAIADPGAKLVAAAHIVGVKVQPLVGPSSILLALMGSGLNGQRFAFQGYLPIDSDERSASIKRLEQESRQYQQTQLFIETPYRNMQMLDALCQHLNSSTRLCIAVDLTLTTESIRTLTVAQWRILLKSQSFNLHKRPALFLFLS